MNRLFNIFLTLFLATSSIFAQTTEKEEDCRLFDLNGQWRNDRTYPDYTEGVSYTYEIVRRTQTLFLNGDTTINDQVYQKIYGTEERTVDLNHPDNRYIAAIREEGQKVFMYRFNEESLLYDFSLTVGDTLEVERIDVDVVLPVKVYVESIDSVQTLDNQWRKRFNFFLFEERGNEVVNRHLTSWIAGIGNVGYGGWLNTHLDGRVYSGYAITFPSFDFFGEDFQCYSENEELVYKNENEENCFIANTTEFAPIGTTWHYGIKTLTQHGAITDFLTVKSVRDRVIKQFGLGKILEISQLGYPAFQTKELTVFERNRRLSYLENGRLYTVYDFNLARNDTFTIKYPSSITTQFDQDTMVTFVIDSIGAMEINNETRAVQYIRNITENSLTQYGTTIVEGIGSLESWLLPFQLFADANQTSNISGLRCYEDNFLGQWQVIDVACDFENYTDIIAPYQPLVIENATWILASNTDVYAETVDYYAYKIQGDSVVNGINYKKLFRYELTLIGGGKFELISQQFQLLMREDTALRKVYGYPTPTFGGNTSNEEFLMLDFAKTVGQSITYFDFNEGVSKTTEIIEDTVEFWFNEDRRTLSTSTGVLLFEGIGYYSGLLETPTPIILPTGGAPVVTSYCRGINFDCNILTATTDPLPQKVAIFPNPATNYLSLQFEQVFDGQIALHSLAGQVVYQTAIRTINYEIEVIDLPKGIYFLHLQAEEGYLVKKIIIQ